MGRSAVEHPIGIPSAGFVNCSSNIHSAAGCEAPYRDETQVLANPPHSLYGFWKDRQNRGINAPFIPAMLFSEIHTTSVRSCWGNQNGGKTQYWAFHGSPFPLPTGIVGRMKHTHPGRVRTTSFPATVLYLRVTPSTCALPLYCYPDRVEDWRWA